MTYATDIDSHFQPILAEGLDFNLLNALLPEMVGCKPTQAQKRHEDLFGDEVQPGHTYYVRPAGAGFADTLKLSQGSMDRVLAALFFFNPSFRALAEDGHTAREKAVHEAKRAAFGIK